MGQGQAEEGGKKGKKEKENDKVVLRVDMHCEACKNKVRKALKSIPGINNIDLNVNEQKATVTGKVNPLQVYEAVKRKCGKRTVLLYPEITEKDRQDAMINSINKIVDSITDIFNPKPPDTTIELKVKMHCGACAKQIKKILLKVEGVTEVTEDLANDKVVVKGRDLVAENVRGKIKRLGKHCEVISLKKDQKKEKKNEDANEGKKDEAKVEKKENEKNQQTKENEKKEEKKENGKKEKKNGSAPKEEKGKAEGKEKAKEQPKNVSFQDEEDNKNEVKKYVYIPYNAVSEYAYAPQIFSDENPNACSVM